MLDQVVLEHLLSQQLLETSVLRLQVLERLGIEHAHPTELVASQVVQGLTEAMLSAYVPDRHVLLGLPRETDDALFTKAINYVQSRCH